MLSRWLWPHRYRLDYLESGELQALTRAVLESPYLAETDLNEGFSGTYGFSLLFQREQLERVERLIPELKPYFRKVLRPLANVFFLNPLVIHAGKGVEPHADKTLVSFVSKGDPPFPFCVSVLYLQLPEQRQGGQLVFHRWFGRHIISPVENLLVEFPGWMLHQVTPLEGPSDAPPRVSLVLEQYDLREFHKSQVPEWYLETSRPFSAFLAELDQPDEEDENES